MLRRHPSASDLEPALAAERQIVLADLIVLGQVRIVVVLAVPLGEARDLAAAPGRLDRQLDRLAVHHRQRAGQPEQTGSTCQFGFSPPNPLAAPSDIFFSLANWTWISRPMMMS